MKPLFKILNDFLAIPTASFKEQWQLEAIKKRFAIRRHFKVAQDQAQNLLVTFNPPRSKKLGICFHAHLDHPGFIFKRSTSAKRGIAEALGGVPERCKGGKLRFFTTPNEKGISAKVARYRKRGKKQEIDIVFDRKIPPGSIGMWDFPHLKRRGKWLDGRAFDDNLGAAVLIYLLEHASRRSDGYSFSVLFTRAEEVGYVGALELLNKKGLKLAPTVVTIEMPRYGAGLVPGDGVMLRAGDRYINFNALLLRYFEDIAAQIKKRSPKFKSQRRLGLFGGTEITSFDLYGYNSGALCLGVVNGHNINRARNGRPAPERVHSDDLFSMVSLLKSIVRTPFDPKKVKEALKKRVEIAYRPQRKRLYRST